MACVSDIDLATLHKTRLEERLNYKLSFQPNHHHRPSQEQHNHNYDGFSSMTRLCLQRNATINTRATTVNATSNTVINLKDLNGNCVMDNLTNKIKHLNFINKQKLLRNRGDSSSSLDDDEDFSYFTSTTRRRRSGTWP